ncbi:MAG TPA: FG-GAP repeat protein, partial [Candidatus Binatia bacterium]|nr:FG-GAP repeat protein [Candidatus Binatia bacterium]
MPTLVRAVRAICLPVLIALPVLGYGASRNPHEEVPAVAQAKISAALGSDYSEYSIRATGHDLALSNRTQQLSGEFDAHHVALRNGDAQWSLKLVGYGYGDIAARMTDIAPRASGNRVEYRRGSVTEWYVNGPAGLEQGFTFAQRPAQRGAQPLTIALALSGNLTAMLDDEDRSLTLSDASGNARLRYAGLTAYDNHGRELRSWLEIQGAHLLIRVDDSVADYPIVVDPTVQLAKLTASDGASGTWLGYSIAISGSTVVVGAPQATVGSNTYQGAAYVFVKPTAGWANMTQTAKLTASDGAPYNYFGISVGIDGGTVVIGSEDAYVNSVPGVGAAYVYVEPAGGWTSMTETAKLTASDGIMDNFFGYSVAVSGSTIVVGEPHQEVNGVYDAGAAYVFVEPTGGWSSMTQTAKLTSGGLQGDQFGQAVAINGNTIAVGAPFATINSAFDVGAAYVFVEPAGGWVNMTPTAELTVSGGAAGQYFGMSVATNGTAVVAGAPGVNSFAGAAYVFAEPSGGWANMTQTAQLT